MFINIFWYSYATTITCLFTQNVSDWNGIWVGGIQTNGIWTWASGMNILAIR